jgi:glycosyltransferase involved in cell wall biosynthesis
MLISVITVNLNCANGLDATIQSVIAQDFLDFQYIVIDGGSTDESKSIIEKYSCKIDHWVSENDSGIYNAMNKGISAACGKYLLFLNSGDTLYSTTTLADISRHLEDEFDLVYGDILVVKQNSSYRKVYPEKLSFNYFMKDTLPHPGCFIRRALFKSVGLYNENRKIVADWEFFLQAVILSRATYLHVDSIVSNFVYDGISSKDENRAAIGAEKNLILESSKYAHFLIDYYAYCDLKRELDLLKENPFYSLKELAKRYIWKIRKRL